jgi:hypothetical protein
MLAQKIGLGEAEPRSQGRGGTFIVDELWHLRTGSINHLFDSRRPQLTAVDACGRRPLRRVNLLWVASRGTHPSRRRSPRHAFCAPLPPGQSPSCPSSWHRRTRWSSLVRPGRSNDPRWSGAQHGGRHETWDTAAFVSRWMRIFSMTSGCSMRLENKKRDGYRTLKTHRRTSCSAE